jgi:hypothetical protein
MRLYVINNGGHVMSPSITETLTQGLLEHAKKEDTHGVYPTAFGRLTAILTSIENHINFHANHDKLFTPEHLREIVETHLGYLD